MKCTEPTASRTQRRAVDPDPKPALHGDTERRHHQWPRLAVGNVAMLDTAYLALVWLVVS
jgi:hypothetical protein